jgi:predicted NAD/FAD-dependent oxidoreductase
MASFTDAYLQAFPAARKRRAATASMSRLLNHPDVKAARAWFYAQVHHEIAREERMPQTANGIWQRLRELGNWRAGPRITIVRE